MRAIFQALRSDPDLMVAAFCVLGGLFVAGLLIGERFAQLAH